MGVVRSNTSLLQWESFNQFLSCCYLFRLWRWSCQISFQNNWEKKKSQVLFCKFFPKLKCLQCPLFSRWRQRGANSLAKLALCQYNSFCVINTHSTCLLSKALYSGNNKQPPSTTCTVQLPTPTKWRLFAKSRLTTKLVTADDALRPSSPTECRSEWRGGLFLIGGSPERCPLGTEAAKQRFHTP